MGSSQEDWQEMERRKARIDPAKGKDESKLVLVLLKGADLPSADQIAFEFQCEVIEFCPSLVDHFF